MKPLSQEYFQDLFKRFPILLLFKASNPKATKVDAVQPLADWQKAMYAVLPEAIKAAYPFPCPIDADDISIDVALERVVLSAVFIEAIQNYDSWGKEVLQKFNTKLSERNIKSLKEVLLQYYPGMNIEKLIMATTFSRIDEILALKLSFKEQEDLSSSPFALHEAILNLFLKRRLQNEEEFFSDFFKIDSLVFLCEQVDFNLQQVLQGECLPETFFTLQKELKVIKEEFLDRIILNLILQQCARVAFELSNTEFANFFILHSSLVDLTVKENTTKVFWDNITALIKNAGIRFSKFKLDNLGLSKSVLEKDAFENPILITLRLTQLLGLPAHDAKLRQVEAQQLEKTIFKEENQKEVVASMAKLARYCKYNNSAVITGAAAVYASLYQAVTTKKITYQTKDFANDIEFVVLVGTTIIANTAEFYSLKRLEYKNFFKNPLCLYKLSEALTKQPQLAINIYTGRQKLIVTARGDAEIDDRLVLDALLAMNINSDEILTESLATTSSAQQKATCKT